MKFQIAINLERVDDTIDMQDVARHTLEMVQLADINNFTSLDIKDYSDYDFVDFNIVSESNKEYGRVSRVLGSKITSLLEVSYLEKSYLIPINEAFIITVNKKEKSIVVKNIEEISSL